MTLPKRFQRLKELEATATNGPWYQTITQTDYDKWLLTMKAPNAILFDTGKHGADERDCHDFDLIAESRNQLRDLLTCLEVAVEELKEAKDGLESIVETFSHCIESRCVPIADELVSAKAYLHGVEYGLSRINTPDSGGDKNG